MSDSEDSDILADIKALDEALSLKTQNATQQRDDSNPLRPSSPCYSIRSTDSESDDECYDYLSTFQCTDVTVLNAYEINTKLTTGLKLVQKKLLNLLNKCEEKLKQLDDKVSNNDIVEYSRQPMTCNAGMPYFKDRNLFRCPKNYDTKLKESLGELSVLSLSKPSRWSTKDKEMLLKAIQNEASEALLARRFSQDCAEKTRKRASDSQSEKSAFALPTNFKEMVESLEEREFDWYKISVTDLENKHSPSECQAMWNVYLHPSIRKSGWSNEESRLLLQYARDNNYQDWGTIAKKLKSSRSAYQCFVRYNTIKKVPTASSWSKTEDKHLTHIINTLRTGDYIPWHEVAYYLPHRTKQQIYTRWMYRKSPHLKKGRFTALETNTLLKAVNDYGADFPKISNKVMPHRSSMQLIEHYKSVMERRTEKSSVWTFNDDVRLIHLRQMLGNVWAKIAKHFPGKSRTRVRHRYTALLKYTRKDICLQDIPRVRGRNKNGATSSVSAPLMVPSVSFNFNVDMSDVHLRLYENLSLPPSKEPSNAQEECYDFDQLVRDTRRSYNVLQLLDARLCLPAGDFLDYVHLSKRDKQLLISLVEYISNAGDNHKQSNALVEQCRARMFGGAANASADSRFVPPLPFNGYIRQARGRRVKNVIKTTSTDCRLNYGEKHLVDVPAHFFPSIHTLPFLSSEEEIQFDKLGEQLTICTFRENTIDLLRSVPRALLSDRKTAAERTWGVDLENCQQPQNFYDYKHSAEINFDSNFHYLDVEEPSTFSDLVLPNEATLLGFKNLLLWKLLYEYQNQHNPALLDEESDEESADHQLLRMRLLRLFKIPIGLSNIKLNISDLDPSVFFDVEQDRQASIAKKRKSPETILPSCSNKKHRCLSDADSSV